MGCCLSIFRSKDSEPASSNAYQLESSEASPAASAAPLSEPERELIYPNPLFAQKREKQDSTVQQIPGGDRQATARQPRYVMYSDYEDPIMMTYNEASKTDRGVHYQSYASRDRPHSNPRRPMAPMTESLMHRGSKNSAVSMKDKADASAGSEGSTLRKRSRARPSEVKEGNDSSDASTSRHALYQSGSPFQQLVWDTYDRKRNAGKGTRSTSGILESASDAANGIEGQPCLPKTRSNISPSMSPPPFSKPSHEKTDQNGLTPSIAHPGQAADGKRSSRSNGDGTMTSYGAFGSPQKVALTTSKDYIQDAAKPDTKEENGRTARSARRTLASRRKRSQGRPPIALGRFMSSSSIYAEGPSETTVVVKSMGSDGSFTGEDTDNGLQQSLTRFSHPGLPPLKITGLDEGEHTVTDEDFLTPDSSSTSSGLSQGQQGSDLSSEQIFTTPPSQLTGVGDTPGMVTMRDWPLNANKERPGGYAHESASTAGFLFKPDIKPDIKPALPISQGPEIFAYKKASDQSAGSFQGRFTELEGQDRYDIIGPSAVALKDTSSMRLLRQRVTGKTFLAKFIARSKGKDLPLWQAKQVLDHSQCCKHPHIVGVEEVLTAERYFCFVMEYVPSGSLTTLLRERSHIPEEEARQYLYQLLLGLQHCHSQAVYHRRLQNDSILMAKEGETLTVKIGGFCQSHMEYELPLEDQSGSKYFTAPELLRRSRLPQGKSVHVPQQIDEKLDTWGAGLAFYYMLYGSHPFMRQGDESYMCLPEAMQHITGASGRSAESPEVSAESRDLLRRTLTADPLQRLGLADMLGHPCMSSLHTGAPT